MVKTKKLKSVKSSLALLLPALICILVLSVFPILRGIWIGFTDFSLGSPMHFNGLQNYITIYKYGFLLPAFINTVIITAYSLIATYLISLLLATLLNKNIIFPWFWRSLLIIPWAISPVAKVGIWSSIFNPINGQLNAILLGLHIINQPIGWTSDIHLALFTVVTITVWGCIPFTTMSFLAALQSVPKENYEAGQLDGANSVQNFWYITMPYLSEITMVTISLLFMWIANDFTSQYLLTHGGPGTATLTIAVQSYLAGFTQQSYGLATAYGNIMIVFCSVILYFYIKFMTKKEVQSI